MINKKLLIIFGAIILVGAIAYASGVVFLNSAPSANISASSIEKGLVGYWPLDIENYNSATNRTTDKTPYSMHSTNYGATLTIDRMGQSNKAMNFDGSSSYIDIPNNVLTNQNTKGMSFSAWVNVTGSGNLAVVGGAPSSSYSYFSSGGVFIASGKPTMVTYSPATGYKTASSSTNIPTNTWVHVVGVYDPSTDYNYIYVNGVLAGSVSGVTDTTTDFSESYIGKNSKDVERMLFNGAIADVRIYNRVLSSTEVSFLYDSYDSRVSSGSLQKGLVLDMPLNLENYNSATSRVTDKTPYSNHGTNYGGSVSSNEIIFDGTSDYVNIDYTSNLAPTSGIGLSVWFNTSDKTKACRIISKTEGGGYQISLNENSACNSNSLCFLLHVAGTYRNVSYPVANLNNNQWYHFASSFNGSMMQLYINGENVGNYSTSGAITYAYNNPFCIGSEPSSTSCTGGGGLYFSGGISDLKIYNRALSADEIKSLYGKGR